MNFCFLPLVKIAILMEETDLKEEQVVLNQMIQYLLQCLSIDIIEMYDLVEF